jgi:hypothetical protein
MTGQRVRLSSQTRDGLRAVALTGAAIVLFLAQLWLA